MAVRRVRDTIFVKALALAQFLGKTQVSLILRSVHGWSDITLLLMNWTNWLCRVPKLSSP